jgi:hypothetical protein
MGNYSQGDKMSPRIVTLNNEHSLTLRRALQMLPNSENMVRTMTDTQDAIKDRGK